MIILLFLVTDRLRLMFITISSVSNISDYVPVCLDVEWHSPKTTNIFDTITYQIPTPLWARATQAQIEQYINNIFIHAYKYIACKMCPVLNMVHIYKNKYI